MSHLPNDRVLPVRLPLHSKERLRAEVWTDADPTGGAAPRWMATQATTTPDNQAATGNAADQWSTGSWGAWDGTKAIALSPTLPDADSGTLGLSAGVWHIWLDATPGAAEEPIRKTHTLTVH